MKTILTFIANGVRKTVASPSGNVDSIASCWPECLKARKTGKTRLSGDPKVTSGTTKAYRRELKVLNSDAIPDSVRGILKDKSVTHHVGL
jgi:hypothetical protein